MSEFVTESQADLQAPSSRDGRPHVLVVGAGAVGTLLGTILGTGGYKVTLVRIFEPDSTRPVELIRPDGSRRTVPVTRVTRTESAARPDLILVAVKQPALREALLPTLGWPEVPTITVENGVGAEETAAAARPRAPVLAGSLTAPVQLASEDVVRWMGRGGIGLAGVMPSAVPHLAPLAEAFGQAGLRACILPDYRSMKWSKLLANLVANASGAILDMDAAAIYSDPRLFDLERRQVLEALAVMRTLGLHPVTLPGAAVPWLARCFRLPSPVGRPVLGRIVGGARAGKSASLRILVASAPPGGPAPEHSEAPWLNGAVARAGDSAGQPAPVNAALAALVDEVASDPARRAWFRGHPERLVAELPPRG